MPDDKREKRIGVVICHCGKNIAGGVDVDALLESTRDIEEVVFVAEHRFSCSEDGQADIQNAIKDHELNRVIIVACDPALHLMTFQRCGEQVGIEPSFVDLIDIRKWTMPGSPERVDP